MNFRVRLQSVLWLNALCALAVGIGVQGFRLHGRSGDFRKKAMMYAAIGNLELQNLATCRAAENHQDPQFRASYADEFHRLAEKSALRVEYYEFMKQKYLRAATRAWERIAPDPPEPEQD
jgi:hypothetical protein